MKKYKLSFIAVLSIFTISSEAFAADLNIERIELASPFNLGIDRIDSYRRSFHPTEFIFDEKRDDDGGNHYYSGRLTKKKEADATFDYTQLDVHASDEKIWSVVKFEKYTQNHMLLKDALIQELKEKYGEPTHSSGLSSGIPFAHIYWLYDNEGNRVEGEHNLDSNEFKNDLCHFSENIIADKDKILTFKKDNIQSACGQFVYAQIYSDNSADLINEVKLMTFDNINK